VRGEGDIITAGIRYLSQIGKKLEIFPVEVVIYKFITEK
jgi:hypothetical protein